MFRVSRFHRAEFSATYACARLIDSALANDPVHAELSLSDRSALVLTAIERFNQLLRTETISLPVLGAALLADRQEQPAAESGGGGGGGDDGGGVSRLSRSSIAWQVKQVAADVLGRDVAKTLSNTIANIPHSTDLAAHPVFREPSSNNSNSSSSRQQQHDHNNTTIAPLLDQNHVRKTERAMLRCYNKLVYALEKATQAAAEESRTKRRELQQRKQSKLLSTVCALDVFTQYRNTMHYPLLADWDLCSDISEVRLRLATIFQLIKDNGYALTYTPDQIRAASEQVSTYDDAFKNAFIYSLEDEKYVRRKMIVDGALHKLIISGTKEDIRYLSWILLFDVVGHRFPKRPPRIRVPHAIAGLTNFFRAHPNFSALPYLERVSAALQHPDFEACLKQGNVAYLTQIGNGLEQRSDDSRVPRVKEDVSTLVGSLLSPTPAVGGDGGTTKSNKMRSDDTSSSSSTSVVEQQQRHQQQQLHHRLNDATSRILTDSRNSLNEAAWVMWAKRDEDTALTKLPVHDVATSTQVSFDNGEESTTSKQSELRAHRAKAKAFLKDLQLKAQQLQQRLTGSSGETTTATADDDAVASPVVEVNPEDAVSPLHFRHDERPIGVDAAAVISKPEQQPQPQPQPQQQQPQQQAQDGIAWPAEFDLFSDLRNIVLGAFKGLSDVEVEQTIKRLAAEKRVTAAVKHVGVTIELLYSAAEALDSLTDVDLIAIEAEMHAFGDAELMTAEGSSSPATGGVVRWPVGAGFKPLRRHVVRAFADVTEEEVSKMLLEDHERSAVTGLESLVRSAIDIVCETSRRSAGMLIDSQGERCISEAKNQKAFLHMLVERAMRMATSAATARRKIFVDSFGDQCRAIPESEQLLPPPHRPSPQQQLLHDLVVNAFEIPQRSD